MVQIIIIVFSEYITAKYLHQMFVFFTSCLPFLDYKLSTDGSTRKRYFRLF